MSSGKYVIAPVDRFALEDFQNPSFVEQVEGCQTLEKKKTVDYVLKGNTLVIENDDSSFSEDSKRPPIKPFTVSRQGSKLGLALDQNGFAVERKNLQLDASPAKQATFEDKKRADRMQMVLREALLKRTTLE